MTVELKDPSAFDVIDRTLSTVSWGSPSSEIHVAVTQTSRFKVFKTVCSIRGLFNAKNNSQFYLERRFVRLCSLAWT